MSIYKVKHQCNICHNGIIVINSNERYKYYYCDKCNLIYVMDKQTEKFVRAYEPRKTIKL